MRAWPAPAQGLLSGGATISNVNISAGTTSNNLSAFVLSNSNNVSFGLNGSTVTASATVASTQASVNISGGTTSNNGNSFVFSNSNNVSFGLNGSTMTATVTVASTQGSVNLSAGSTSNLASAFTFSNAGGVSFGLNASTITAQVQMLSSFAPYGLSNTQTMTWNGASVSHAVAFNVPNPMSGSFIRIPVLMTTQSTSLATTAQAATSFQAAIFSTVNAVLYSLATGANSKSLTSVASGSAGFTLSNKISISNTSNYSQSDGFTYQVEGGQTSTSSQWSVTQTRIDLVTTNWQSQYSSLRFVDINFANSIPAGAYWLVLGMTSSSSTNNASYAAGTNVGVSYSNHYGNSQANSNFGVMGSTNLSTGGFLQAGSFSTAGGGTTAGFPISAISSSASNVMPYFQLLRSA